MNPFEKTQTFKPLAKIASFKVNNSKKNVLLVRNKLEYVDFSPRIIYSITIDNNSYHKNYKEFYTLRLADFHDFPM